MGNDFFFDLSENIIAYKILIDGITNNQFYAKSQSRHFISQFFATLPLCVKI